MIRKNKVTSSMGGAVKLALEKLAQSDLTTDDARILGMEFLDKHHVQKLHKSYNPVSAIKINYFDPLDPKKHLSGWHNCGDFYRLRYLEQEAGFGQLTDKKELRYVQEPDSGVCAYFPRSIADWPRIFKDAEQSLVITEGEFKAACACKVGIPTIGLGGVYNYRSTSSGIMFLRELEKINWVKRRVYIIYDSDARTNDMVCNAINALADELMYRGAYPYYVSLPHIDDASKKTGLDDYIVSIPVKNRYDELQELIKSTRQLITMTEPLWQLNNEVTYVQDPGLILVKATNQKMTPSNFKEHSFSTTRSMSQEIVKGGEVKTVMVSAAAQWLKWPLRASVGSLTYKPGHELYIDHENPMLTQWNTWQGWGIEPKKGDVKPFLKLIDHVFTGAEPQAKIWFMRWCAYPIQYPGVKLYSSAVIHGIRHGTGKSLIGYTLGMIYGKNFTEIDQSDLHDSFNEWAVGKQFIMGDDITGSNKREDNDRLKKMITQRQIRINAKFLPTYTIPDCINYFFTANHPDSFFMEDDDRRNFIHEVIVGPLSEEFYLEYDLWLSTGGGAAVFDYLLKLDLGDFNPAAPALRTFAKDRMIADVKSDLGSWVAKLLADPDSMLKIGQIKLQGDMFTGKQLLDIYDPTSSTKITANGIGRELKRAGVSQVLQGRIVRTSRGVDRYYIIRNRERWQTIDSVIDVTKYLEMLFRREQVSRKS